MDLAFAYGNAGWGREWQKNLQNQHWQAEDMLIGHPITNLYVNEALLSANGSTAFPDMGCADCSPQGNKMAFWLLKGPKTSFSYGLWKMTINKRLVQKRNFFEL